MSKTFCNFPWKQIYISTSGNHRICCMNQHNITKDDGYFHFNMARDKMSDSWNSEYMKAMRVKLMNGEKHENCGRCYQQEELGHQAMRDDLGMEELIKNTSKDGTYNVQPNNIELHFGNLCNLACKMCSQNYSTTIGKELLKMGENDPEFLKWVKSQSGNVNNWTGQLDVAYDWFKDKKIKLEVFEHVSKNITALQVIGGEPTVIKEFWELLEYLDNKNTLAEKHLLISTNLTNVNPKLTRWLGKTKSWTIAASIDGIGDRNRYIRYPSDWNTILRNLKFYNEIKAQTKKGQISYGPAIQLLNIDQIVDLCRFFEESSPGNHGISGYYSHVKYPVICDYDIAPPEYKLKVADKLEKQIKDLRSPTYMDEISSHIDALRREVFTEDQRNSYLKMFMRFNDTQDKFRNTKTWRELLPDLESAISL
jgi:MoaA/NifB/PqqE/SkfB family radical SAM enzyme